MNIKQKTVKKSLVEEGLSQSADQYKLAESMALNFASFASSAQHLKSVNRSMASVANRKTFDMSMVDRFLKAGFGIGAIVLAADKINARTQLVDIGEDWKLQTTNLEQFIDVIGAGLNLAGGLVNVGEGASGNYLIDLFDIPFYKGGVTALYGLAGGVGAADTVRTLFQSVDKPKKA